MEMMMILLIGLSVVSICTFRVKNVGFRMLMTLAWMTWVGVMVVQWVNLLHH
jgi:hypothetical protein